MICDVNSNLIYKFRTENVYKYTCSIFLFIFTIPIVRYFYNIHKFRDYRSLIPPSKTAAHLWRICIFFIEEYQRLFVNLIFQSYLLLLLLLIWHNDTIVIVLLCMRDAIRKSTMR